MISFKTKVIMKKTYCIEYVTAELLGRVVNAAVLLPCVKVDDREDFIASSNSFQKLPDA